MKFEYKTIMVPQWDKTNDKVNYLTIEPTLNKLGKEGWELVSVVSDVGSNVVYVFKRII